MKSIAVESDCKHVPSGSFFPCHRSDLCLAVLKRHHAFQFFGAFDLQVLHGSVKAHGYDFEAAAYNEKKFIPICAPYMLGPPITVFSTPSEDAINFGRLKWRIQEVSNAAAAILEIIRIGDAVLLLRFLASKAALCARNLHDVILFIPSSGDSLMLDSLCCVLRTQWNVCINSTDQSFVAVIDYLQKRRCRNITTVVMLTGGKGVGKSTSARYIANSLLLKTHAPIYFLDADVGQSEANPPGCVSLFCIESPMLGVPFCNQRGTFTNSFFFGDISPSGNLELYFRLVVKLYEQFIAMSFPGSVLIVNTAGWVEDDGAKLLDRLIAKMEPDCLFNIVSKEEPNYQGDGIKELQENERAFVINHAVNFIPRPSKSLPFTLTPAALRNLLTMGYIAPLCPTPSLGSLNKAAPYAVPFSRISIYVNPGLDFVPETHLLALLNCSLVALCSVRWENDEVKGKQHILNDETMPGMIEGDSVVLRCVGFGVIRAIDLDERLFYVLTPVADQVLNEVNVFAKGANIDIPSAFLVQRASREAPYVVNCRGGPSNEMYSELALISCYKRTKFSRKPTFLD